MVAKGLINGEQNIIQYLCKVVNRFQCPYNRMNIKEGQNIERTSSNFDVEDLFKLQRMAFMVEIALARARKENSKIQIRDKH